MINQSVISPPNSVRPMLETDRDKPDGRAKRDGKKPQARDSHHEESNPIANDRGEITGKLIDVVA